MMSVAVWLSSEVITSQTEKLMCLSVYTLMVQVVLELNKLPFRTAQIHLELPFWCRAAH